MAMRPVDLAMADDRPPKRAVRSLWVQEVREVETSQPDCDRPWYLTLPGAQGSDLQLLIQEGLINLTEVRSIAPEHSKKFVAVERNSDAVFELSRRFPGLWIKRADVADLVAGPNPLAWPTGDARAACRALVVNLDLNTGLVGRHRDDRTTFRVVELVHKLCQIHADPPCLNWTLLLTLHGQVHWDVETDLWIKRFLQENLNREPAFATMCLDFLGPALVADSAPQSGALLTDLPSSSQQRLACVLVPKLIAQYARIDGWRMETSWNLAYGGGQHAPMVTWGMRFLWDDKAAAVPDGAYREALRGILRGIGSVTDEGEIVFGVDGRG